MYGTCNEAEAESGALEQVDSSIQTSLSDGSLENALATNLMDVNDCGAAFDSCTAFQESAKMATATTEVFQREYIIIICDPAAFVSFSTFSPGSSLFVFNCLLFDIAPVCPEGQSLKTFCAADECKAFNCIDPHKVKVCIKHGLGLGKMDGEEKSVTSEGSMLRIPSHFLPDSVELCLPVIAAQTLVSFGHADCGACEDV